MANAVNINWGLLKQPDYVGDYQNAFEAGRRIATPVASGTTDTMNGSGAEASTPPPVAVANAFSTAAPVAAPGGGAPADVDGALAGLSTAERARAADQADLLANLALGLRGVPYGDRGRMLIHLAPALAARGVPPAVLSSFDPTDAALDAAATQARALHGRFSPG